MTAKFQTGVDLDKGVVDGMDGMVEECRDLQMSRSEAINAILGAFLDAELEEEEKIRRLRHLVIVNRKK